MTKGDWGGAEEIESGAASKESDEHAELKAMS